MVKAEKPGVMVRTPASHCLLSPWGGVGRTKGRVMFSDTDTRDQSLAEDEAIRSLLWDLELGERQTTATIIRRGQVGSTLGSSFYH